MNSVFNSLCPFSNAMVNAPTTQQTVPNIFAMNLKLLRSTFSNPKIAAITKVKAGMRLLIAVAAVEDA
uniref:Uncharacterized protein n=1 Tax=Lotus japonicus TaxID=34305 RepID=I3SF67_LOTJA|nr:unknown [Lotus japonicus]